MQKTSCIIHISEKKFPKLSYNQKNFAWNAASMPTLKLAGAPICLDILALESLSTVTTGMYSEPPCLEIKSPLFRPSSTETTWRSWSITNSLFLLPGWRDLTSLCRTLMFCSSSCTVSAGGRRASQIWKLGTLLSSKMRSWVRRWEKLQLIFFKYLQSVIQEVSEVSKIHENDVVSIENCGEIPFLDILVGSSTY